MVPAASGQQLGLNVVAEFVGGLLLPGQAGAVMTFKTLSYMAMSQGLAMVADLKLGQYVKIAPRAMFVAQLAATVVAAVVDVAVATAAFEGFGHAPESAGEFTVPGDAASGPVWALQSATSAPRGWTANSYAVFVAAGVVWGAVGPRRFFMDPGSPYGPTLWGGLLAGAVLPAVVWAVWRWWPWRGGRRGGRSGRREGGGRWWCGGGGARRLLRRVNVPLLAAFPAQAGSLRSDMLTPLLAGLAVGYVARRRWPGWWRRRAFVLAAALDAGTAAGLAAMFAARYAAGPAAIEAAVPHYVPFNFADGEGCAPAYYLACSGGGGGSGHSAGMNGQCVGFGGDAATG
ncbi:hypothetical protein HK405_009762 [Cladochytrium tenue]|nr:hypothetical protein HK405_009762 [Cladochytrium tenue]